MLSLGSQLLTALVAAAALGASSTHAAQLLSEISGSGDSSRQTPGPPATGTPGIVFGLFYEWTSFYDGKKMLGLDASLAIGDGLRPFSSGSTGSLDFNAANSPDLGALAAVLTSGAPATIATANLVLLEGVLKNGQPFMGDVEQGPFSPPPLLVGAEVSFIRLQVNSVAASVRTDGTFGFSYTTDARWQIWGNPAPPVPEPSSALLLGAGCAALIAMTAWRRPRNPTHSPAS